MSDDGGDGEHIDVDFMGTSKIFVTQDNIFLRKEQLGRVIPCTKLTVILPRVKSAVPQYFLIYQTSLAQHRPVVVARKCSLIDPI